MDGELVGIARVFCSGSVGRSRGGSLLGSLLLVIAVCLSCWLLIASLVVAIIIIGRRMWRQENY